MANQKLDPSILNVGKKFKKEITRIIAAIKRYDRIAIFRHIMPDYDALGCQLGMAQWIKDNFPEKEVRVLGDNHVTFTPRLVPEMDNLNEAWFKEPFLAIILDTANQSRVADPRFKKAKFKIKIDHHPDVDHFGKVSVVDTTTAAAAELVVALLLNIKGNYKLTKEAATWFHMGIVGDSGSFRYSSVSPLTFAIASVLASTGVEISKLVQSMFLKQIDDLKVTAYILNNFKISPKGVAYYILDRHIQEELKITTERGKENVNLFANIEGIPAWCSITEDPKDNCWRISIRSKQTAINGVAAMFEGGGHAQASGAKINSLADLDRFIGELDKLF